MQKMYVANKALIVNQEGKILCLTDSGKTEGHNNMTARWDFPGGRMDKGELPREGLVRELKEEVGLDIKEEDGELFFTHKWGVGGDSINEPIVGLFYVVKIDNFEPNLSDEHTSFRWLSIDEILSEDFINKSPLSFKETVKAYKERFL